MHLALAEATDPQARPGPSRVASAPRRPPARTSRSPRSSSAPPPARRRAAGSAPPPRSSSAPRRCHPTRPPSARDGCCGGQRQARCRCARRARCSLLGRGRGRAARRAAGAPGSSMLRGQIAFDQRRAGEAARLLAGAARRLEPLDRRPGARRRTSRRSAPRCGRATATGRGALRSVAEAALRAPPPARPGRRERRRCSTRSRCSLTEGHAAAAPSLRSGARAACSPRTSRPTIIGRWLWFAVTGNAVTVAQELWDAEAWHALAARHEQFARDTGALVQLQFALNMLAWVHVVTGELRQAALAARRGSRRSRRRPGTRRSPTPRWSLAAWRGRGATGRRADRGASARRRRPAAWAGWSAIAAYASAVLHNGLGRHDEALRRRAIGLRARSRRVRAVRRARAGRGGGRGPATPRCSRRRSSGSPSARA